MSMSDPNSSLKKRTKGRGNSGGRDIDDDFIIEDDDDFVIVECKPKIGSPSSKNLQNSITSIEDDFVMGDFGGVKSIRLGEESEEEKLGEESCLLQNRVESHLPVVQQKGEESEISQKEGDESKEAMESFLLQNGVESCLVQHEGEESEVKYPEEEVCLQQERVEPHLLQERGVGSEEEKVESLQQEGEELQLLQDSSTAERGGVAPQELTDNIDACI